MRSACRILSRSTSPPLACDVALVNKDDVVNNLVDLFLRMMPQEDMWTCSADHDGGACNHDVFVDGAGEHASKTDLVAALSEWLDCQDNWEVIKTEAAQAEEDMEACVQWQTANNMTLSWTVNKIMMQEEAGQGAPDSEELPADTRKDVHHCGS